MADDLQTKRRGIQKQLNAEKDPRKKAALQKQLSSVRNEIKKGGREVSIPSGEMAGPDLSTPEGAMQAENEQIQKSIEQQQKLNRVNETNPFGSLSYTEGPDGRLTQTTTLSGNQQGLVDNQERRDLALGQAAQGLTGAVNRSYTEPFSLEGVGNDPRNFNFDAERRRLEDSYMSRFNDVNGSRFQQEQQQIAQDLANKGIPVGSELYNQEMERLSRQQGDERRGALTQALAFGGDEMTRTFGMGQQARQNAINDRLLVRDRPYQELTNVLGSMQGPTLPNFQPRSEINVPYNDATDTALGYGQLAFNQRQLGQQASENAKDRALQWRIASMPPKGGGGGGGGGAGPLWSQYGFSSPMEYDNYKRQQQRDDAMWNWQNNPQYRGQKGPSSGQQWGGFLGNAAGSFLGGLGYSYGQGLGSKLGK